MINLLVLFLLRGSYTLAQDEVYSCGGFISSAVPVNYASIMVKLYTRSGHLKYETECAPNNGYYMIPVYSKGSYILKVEPPPGWEFEPDSIELTIDGVNDPCTLGTDVNFRFKGFSVVGKVCNGGECNEKASDIEVGLFKKASDSVPLLKSNTDKSGKYAFRGVSSGEYVVKLLQNDICTPDNQIVKVVVSETTFSVSSDLVINAFAITGRVRNKGQPVSRTILHLYSETKPKLIPLNCDKITTAKTSADKPFYICSTTSDSNGQFGFACTAPGRYKIIASYEIDGVKFDVKPPEIAFQLTHSSMELKETFEIQGFTVVGRVLWSKEGKAVEGARVNFDGKDLPTLTDSEGTYHVTKVESGTHKISVVKENAEFQMLSVDLNAKQHKIQDILPSKFKLCGKINVNDGADNKILRQRKLLLTNMEKKTDVASISTDGQGRFCKMVDVGLYTLEPQILPEEKKAGFALDPRSLEVNLKTGPKLDANFDQFMAKASGLVKCLDKCQNLKVILFLNSAPDSPLRTVELASVQKEAAFHFDGLTTSMYSIKIVADSYCWKSNVITFSVTNSNVNNLLLEQTGYSISVVTSHELTLAYSATKSSSSSKINLKRGTNSFCLPLPGQYNFRLDSCHIFENIQNNAFVYDTSSPNNVITLHAIKHKTDGVIVSSEPIDNLYLYVKSVAQQEKESVTTLGPLKSASTGKEDQPETVYYFEYWSKGETLNFAPKSTSHLFNPETLNVEVKNDCISGLKLAAQRGKFLKIVVQPSLGGVAITLTSKTDPYLQLSNWTDNQGTCSLGPLRSFDNLNVRAEKSAYILTEVDNKLGHFDAFKLSELTLKVVDTNKNALPGVLLSLSGKNYRSNNITGENGLITFVGLSPGEYFVKPILKEYSFEPPTKIVKIIEGSTLTVELSGKRVAYSCIGLVRHLAGQPVPNVEIEAFPQTDCVVPQAAHEESITSDDGVFKLKGLFPACRYRLQVKPGQASVPQTIPAKYIVEVNDGDLSDKDFILKPEYTTVEVAGRVDGDRSLFQSIKIVIYKEDNLDQPLHSLSLHSSSVFFFPALPMDNKMYVVKLESSLPVGQYYKEQAEVVLRANKTFHFINLSFNPRRKLNEAENIRGGYIIIPLVVLLMLLAYNYEKVAFTCRIFCGHLMYLITIPPNAASTTGSSFASRTRSKADLPSDTGVDNFDLFEDNINKRKVKMRKT